MFCCSIAHNDSPPGYGRDGVMGFANLQLLQRLRKSRKTATRKIKEKKAAGFCIIQRMQLFISAGFASSGRVILFLKALGSL
ncbi:MAG: hypothetical protein DBY39_05240 [Clostridiales bacterium]|nr:MAG: hypothetical protein DBY39_05240 [Clostridiales bacterium]